MGRPVLTTNVALTTDFTPITVPEAFPADVLYGVVMGCTSSGIFINWLRANSSDSTEPVTCRDGKEGYEISARKGSTIFYAKVASGTGTLELEWWVF